MRSLGWFLHQPKTGFEGPDLAEEFLIILAFLGDRSYGVHDSRVVSAAEMGTNFFERVLGILAGEVHSNLARMGDRLVPAFAQEIRPLDVVEG